MSTSPNQENILKKSSKNEFSQKSNLLGINKLKPKLIAKIKK